MKNNNIRKIAQLVFCSVLMASCSDWTETESLNIKTPTLENSNPELYESYLASLREYKASEHKVVIAKFDNKETNPVGQGEHISALPDSVDYVILNNLDKLNPVIKGDIYELRKKGTQTVCDIDYSLIEDEFNLYIENLEENVDRNDNFEHINETNEETTDDKFIEFCSQRLDNYLNLYKEYGFDGINVVYNGVDPLSLKETERLQLEMRHKVFFEKIKEWKENHKDMLFFFEGKPQNVLYDRSLFHQATYLIISNESASNSKEILLQTKMSLVEGIPTDRIIFGVTIPSLTDNDDKTGYFDSIENGKPMYATKCVALIVVSANEDFIKSGLCISRSQNDYYYPNNNYKNINEAISIMNPSPLN